MQWIPNQESLLGCRTLKRRNCWTSWLFEKRRRSVGRSFVITAALPGWWCRNILYPRRKSFSSRISLNHSRWVKSAQLRASRLCQIREDIKIPLWGGTGHLRRLSEGRLPVGYVHDFGKMAWIDSWLAWLAKIYEIETASSNELQKIVLESKISEMLRIVCAAMKIFIFCQILLFELSPTESLVDFLCPTRDFKFRFTSCSVQPMSCW